MDGKKREREREGAWERETRPLQVNNPTKHVIGLVKSERAGGLSSAADH